MLRGFSLLELPCNSTCGECSKVRLASEIKGVTPNCICTYLAISSTLELITLQTSAMELFIKPI